MKISKEIGLPYWNGEKIDRDNKLFVYQEQGLGDNIQFFRFLLELKKTKKLWLYQKKNVKL